MSDQPPKPEPLLKNPQVVAAIIGGAITIVVAIVGLVPVILNRNAPTPQAVVLLVTPTPLPVTQPPDSTPTPVPAVNVVPTTESIAAINTELPTIAPTQPPVPTATSLPASPVPATQAVVANANVLLLYDDVSFTLLNQTNGKLSLEGVTFHSDAGNWDARDWGPSVYNSLPASMCLRLRDTTAGQRQPPAPCRNKIYGLIEVGTSAFFWIGVSTFDVLRNGTVIATCTVSDQTCAVAIG